MKTHFAGHRRTVGFLLIVALADVAFCAGVLLIARRNLYRLVDGQIQNQIDDLKNFLAAHNGAPVPELERAMKDAYAAQHSGDYLEVFTEDGELLYRSASLQGRQSVLLLPEEVRRPLARSERLDNRPFRFLYEKVKVNGRTFTVEMGMPADDALEMLRSLRTYLLIFGALFWLVTTGAGYCLERKSFSQ